MPGAAADTPQYTRPVQNWPPLPPSPPSHHPPIQNWPTHPFVWHNATISSVHFVNDIQTVDSFAINFKNQTSILETRNLWKVNSSIHPPWMNAKWLIIITVLYWKLVWLAEPKYWCPIISKFAPTTRFIFGWISHTFSFKKTTFLLMQKCFCFNNTELHIPLEKNRYIQTIYLDFSILCQLYVFAQNQKAW